MAFEIRKCEDRDLKGLLGFSREAFRDSFGAFNTKENMDMYMESSLSEGKLNSDYSCPDCSFYLLFWDINLAGYIKLNEAPSQTDIQDPESLELERIYVSKALKGRGLGRKLIEKAISEAVMRGKEYLWLGVWEKNESAIGFYKKQGFYTIDTHSFLLGKDIQTDYIMRKDI